MKIFILKKRKDFIRAAQSIKSVTPSLILQAAPSLSAKNKILSDDCCYVGFTATKKLGKANVRNRVKRRLRAIVAQTFPELAIAKTDYVVIGRFKTATIPFESLKSDMIRALNEIVNLQKNKKEQC